MLEKIISGNNTRKTRLHDEKGNRIRWSLFIKHAPVALLSGLLRLAFDKRPELPWISYTAIDELEKFLNKNSRVLEFGSGMSTIWYARKAGEVFSVEDYEPWFRKVENLLKTKNIKNVNYVLAGNSKEYSEFMSEDMDGFDLIMVDGSVRSECIKSALKLLRKNGIIYLDNSDKDSEERGGDMRIAERLALDFAKQNNADVIYFTDFAPTQLFVQQGMMVRKRN